MNNFIFIDSLCSKTPTKILKIVMINLKKKYIVQVNLQ